MMPRYKYAIYIFGKHMQNNMPLMLNPLNYPMQDSSFQQVRSIKKHFNQKYRKERGQKFIKIELPVFNKTDEMVQEEIRTHMKRHGLLPQRSWQERPIIISSTPQIFESYIVPEGDGKFSTMTKIGAKQKAEYIEKKSKSFLAIRKIKRYDEEFTTAKFGEEALEIYKKAHEALAAKDEDKLLQYATEVAYPIMMHNMHNKTIVWKFLESLEPARVVHARVTDFVTKHNHYAQVTVRFHTQQILSIYDRFGRLLLGSETVKKDVLDYVVFEKHLSNVYGTWRIHGKIVPDWMAPDELPGRTYMLPKEEETNSDSLTESVAQTVPPETLDDKHESANA